MYTYNTVVTVPSSCVVKEKGRKGLVEENGDFNDCCGEHALGECYCELYIGIILVNLL